MFASILAENLIDLSLYLVVLGVACIVQFIGFKLSPNGGRHVSRP